MTDAYKQQITETFRDNAVRSVLLIDDEYMSYPGLAESKALLPSQIKEALEDELNPELSELDIAKARLEKIRELTNKDEQELKRTPIAKEFVSFFHGQKFICDVENKTDELKAEKITKSDLIVLDYILEDDNPEPSLKLLSELSKSKHMNVVAIYTGEELERVWLETASTLRGSPSLEPDDFFSDYEEDRAAWKKYAPIYLESWGSIKITELQQINYILGDTSFVNGLLANFIEDCEEYNVELDTDIPLPTEKLLKFLIEIELAKSNKANAESSGFEVHGEFGKWIQAGDIFISLCAKGNGEEGQPERVWDNLKESLHSWYPSFYRVVLSELQNRIEDSNFSMSKVLDKPHHTQVSFLWNIINQHEGNKLIASETILGHLLEDLSDELLKQSPDSLPEFVKKTAKSIKDELPDYVEFERQNIDSHKVFMKETIAAAKSNHRDHKIDLNDAYYQHVAHAYNEQISVVKTLPSYITTGMILKIVKPKKSVWYMCVTPSCDTVPSQKTNQNAKELAPHRLLTFAQLHAVDLGDALPLAHQSSHVFITDDGERKALRVINNNSKQPDLVKFVITNHCQNDLTKDGKIALIMKKNGDGIRTTESTMIPVALLKPSYAARYQAVQSHHEGRIGVDFSTLDISMPEPEELVIGNTQLESVTAL